MAEEDEIDVLGDFSLDNILSKNDSAIFDNSALVSQNSDFFNCDYTIHPQWLLDKPSTNPACWYNTNAPGGLELTDFDQTQSNGPPAAVAENSINDESGWTEKEKTLLNRGIEIFGKSYTRLSQFVGTKTPAEVKYFLYNFHSDIQQSYTSVSEDVLFERNCIQESINAERNVSEAETIEDSEIPASIEEVIAAVSTAEPTVNSKLNKTIPKSFAPKKIGQHFASSTKRVSSLLQHNKTNKVLKPFHNKKNLPKVKFKTAVQLSNVSFVKKKRIRQKNTRSKINIIEQNHFDSPKAQIHIFTGKNVSVPVCNGEEVITIQKENLSESGSDIEIDIEDDETWGNKKINSMHSNSTITNNLQFHLKTANNNNDNRTNIKSNAPIVNNQNLKQPIERLKIDYCGLSPSLISLIQSEKYPEKEYLLPNTDATELEKYIFDDFFESRGTKTPNRYLKIRNHILEAWYHTKPAYVTKTSTRQGLKNCGDVKNIGKIHTFLEQIGAINFGTVQVNYTRPLSEWISSLHIKEKPREKATAISINTVNIDGEKLPFRSRQKKFINDGEGGCTLTHNESGSIIKTTVINEDPVQKPRPYTKKPTVRLIYCRPFPDTRKQERRVRMSLSALLLMDLHAHMSLTEVMGLVGGYLLGDNNQVEITRYVPCKNVAPSLTHCDMCPVSQANATDVIHQEGLRVLGWFHSHPTFAPEPSQTDLDTQLSVQLWLGGRHTTNDCERGKTPPCIGIILSPFSSQGALIASPYRCMIVEHTSRIKGKEKGAAIAEGSEYVPYKFNVDLSTDNFEVDTFLNQAWNLLKSEHIPAQKRLKFHNAYFQNEKLTYLDKFITSVKMHLAKCSNLNKMTCDLLVDGLSDICLNRV